MATQREFLRALFSSAGIGARILIRTVPESTEGRPEETHLDAQDPDAEALAALPTDRHVYFGAAIRLGAAPDKVTAIWADIDEEPGWSGRWDGPACLVPTAIVLTGKPVPVGYHAWFALEASIEGERAVGLVRLAKVLLGGDPRVVDHARVMRLPDTWNVKQEYGEPRPVVLAHLDPAVRYGADELEERLLGGIAQRAWSPGNGHGIALSLGALLDRAGWAVERIRRAVEYSLEGEEVALAVARSRVQAAAQTVERRSLGHDTSASTLREALGTEAWKDVLKGLGITARDGDVLLDGEAIGKIQTIERDATDLFLDSRDWAWADGSLARWDETRWRIAHIEELTGAVFGEMRRMTVVHEGLERDYAPTHKTCHAVAKLVGGSLQSRPMAAMSALLLPVTNGVLNLATGEVLPHGREFRNRWVLPVEYDPQASSPRWEAFLGEVVDAEVIPFLQEWIGYLLIEGNLHHKMLWLYGPSGTGKSTFLGTVTKLLGPAAVAITADNLGPYEVAGLAGARVAVCSEIASHMLKTTTLKSLISGDMVSARHPYGRPFNLTFGGKFCWSSNALPPVDQGEGMWRRLDIVQFLRKPKKKDERLSTSLEKELGGVLNWAIVGLRRFRALGESSLAWTPPPSVVGMVEGYKEAADHFAQFVGDELLLLDDEDVAEKKLYARYRWWAEDKGLKPRELGPIFWNEMTRIGLRRAEARDGDRTVRVWKGATLLPENFG